jgi:hypothetical protein
VHAICRHVYLFCRGPAVIIPLGDPLMTLTDTIFIGQVAALAPNHVTLCQFECSSWYAATHITAVDQLFRHARCSHGFATDLLANSVLGAYC